MADPWAKKLKWIAVIVIAVGVMAMSFKAGWLARDIVGFEERDSSFFNRLDRGAERYEEARRRWAECRSVDTLEACT